ncbi:hypothetical protein [Nonomuraea sp. NPDC049709]|uniref:hypothetical protein n=1 Tax=Nonomuraea sp. NPDC049709 TaxID=3154736 RepID=UPI00342A68E5
MTAGIPINQDRINTQAGAIAASVFSALQNVEEFKAWLDTISVNDLETVYGFSADDANVLKSAYADLADLVAIWAGGAPAATLPHDYRVFARRLIGVGVY